ncbi:hypothetical protein DENSPDRAFT_567548 [Dentipellis sp. KUC8613]|nr:hypothetical protein DENSPDRAFT_567548 [Dentipellis sp. KUC8613]
MEPGPMYGGRAPAGRSTLDGQPWQAERSTRNGRWHTDVEAQRARSQNAQEMDEPKREGEVSIDSLRADDGVQDIPEGQADEGDEHDVEWHAERLTREVLDARRPAIKIPAEKANSSPSPAPRSVVLDYHLNISRCRHELKRFRDATEFMHPEDKFVPLYTSTRVRIFRRCDAALRTLRRQSATGASLTSIREELHRLAVSLGHFESLLVILSDSKRLPEANVFSLLSYSIQFYNQKFNSCQEATIPDLVSSLNDDIKGLSTDVSSATESGEFRLYFILFISDPIHTVNFTKRLVIERLSNHLIGATFFSSVTATTISITFQDSHGLGNAVNAFWFLSLVLSVASVATSISGLGLRYQTHSGIPKFSDYKFPILYSWFEVIPAVLLTLSIAFFAIGFVFFMYSSSQNLAVSIVVTASVGIVMLCFALVSLKFKTLTKAEVEKHRIQWLYRPFQEKEVDDD